MVETPGVAPGDLYGNGMVAHLITEHYLHGLTAGNISRREGINEGAFFHMAHWNAALLEPAVKRFYLNCAPA